MSFILDALRKSENERQRGALPSIAQVPLAAPRQSLPAWAIGVIGALALALVVLAAAWWTTIDGGAPSAQTVQAPMRERPLAIPPPPSTAATASPFAAEPTPAARASGMGDVAPAPSPPEREPLSLDPNAPEPVPREPAAAPSSGSTRAATLAPPATRPLERVAAPESSAPEPTLEPSPGAPEPSAAPPPAPTLPSAAALAAQGVALPQLSLELHVFHRDRPSDRLIIVNGQRYREGETLREGPRVEAIEPVGAVLSYQGRRFVLSPE